MYAPGLKNGLFILDIYGGTESIIVKNNEVRDVPGFTTQQGIDVPNFEYVWDQAAYNPINHHTTCHIILTCRHKKIYPCLYVSLASLDAAVS